MMSQVSKVFLKNTIRHTEFHNKMVEEDEMWRSHLKRKERHKVSKKPYRKDSEHRQKVRSSCVKIPRAHMDRTDTSPHSYMGREDILDKNSRFVAMQKLQEFEEKDPERWGHGGFKEQNPDLFYAKNNRTDSSAYTSSEEEWRSRKDKDRILKRKHKEKKKSNDKKKKKKRKKSKYRKQDSVKVKKESDMVRIKREHDIHSSYKNYYESPNTKCHQSTYNSNLSPVDRHYLNASHKSSSKSHYSSSLENKKSNLSLKYENSPSSDSESSISMKESVSQRRNRSSQNIRTEEAGSKRKSKKSRSHGSRQVGQKLRSSREKKRVLDDRSKSSYEDSTSTSASEDSSSSSSEEDIYFKRRKK